MLNNYIGARYVRLILAHLKNLPLYVELQFIGMNLTAKDFELDYPALKSLVFPAKSAS